MARSTWGSPTPPTCPPGRGGPPRGRTPPAGPGGAGGRGGVAAPHPPLALWGGPDGLDVVRGLLVTAARLLRPGGWLGIEHADQQGSSLPALVRASGGWSDVTDNADLAGRPRYTTARLGGASRGQ